MLITLGFTTIDKRTLPNEKENKIEIKNILDLVNKDTTNALNIIRTKIFINPKYILDKNTLPCCDRPEKSPISYRLVFEDNKFKLALCINADNTVLWAMVDIKKKNILDKQNILAQLKDVGFSKIKEDENSIQCENKKTMRRAFVVLNGDKVGHFTFS